MKHIVKCALLYDPISIQLKTLINKVSQAHLVFREEEAIFEVKKVVARPASASLAKVGSVCATESQMSKMMKTMNLLKDKITILFDESTPVSL